MPLRFVSGSPRRGLVFCGLLAAVAGAVGCTRESAPPTTPAALTEPGASAGLDPPGAAADDPSGSTEPTTTASNGDADTPAPTASADSAVAADRVDVAVAPEEPVVVDMTPQAAPAICASLVDEPESVRRCAFQRGGLSLPGGARADVLELEYDSMEIGEVVAAYLVVRMPIDEYPTTQLLGERSDVPGMSTTYSLGRLERTPTGLRVRVTLTDTTYPDTGGPGPGRAEVERARVVVTCTLDAETQYYDCERS